MSHCATPARIPEWHRANAKPALRRVSTVLLWNVAAPEGSPKSLQEHVLFGITHLPSRWLPPDLPCLGGGFHCTLLDATGIEGQSRAGRSSTSISDDFGLRNSSLHLAWIGVRYRTMLYCVNTIQATALFPSIWPELSVLSGCPNLRRHHLQPRTFLDYEMPVPLMAIQRRMGELNKRARSTHTSRRSAQTTRNCCQQYWSGYSIRAVASHENRIVRMMGWPG